MVTVDTQPSARAPASHQRMTDKPTRRRTFLMLAVAIAAVAAAAIGFAVFGKDDEQTLRAGKAVVITPEALRTFVKDAPVPVFWAGRRPNTELEYTETSDKRSFVRYLTGSADAGDPRPVFVSIVTYPRPEALAELKRVAKRKGVVSAPAPGGGLSTYDKAKPLSVYVAYPRQSVLVEVYAPKAGDARSIVRSGNVRPVR